MHIPHLYSLDAMKLFSSRKNHMAHYVFLWSATLCISFHFSAAHKEHKVHNIVLYPDKHSWCNTTPIKQVVAYPDCNSVEIDNNVCVGTCFSYSIPRTVPSSPGELIKPYCDSCQPSNVIWQNFTLTCNGVEHSMQKSVQIITNCSCSSCDRPRHNTNIVEPETGDHFNNLAVDVDHEEDDEGVRKHPKAHEILESMSHDIGTIHNHLTSAEILSEDSILNDGVFVLIQKFVDDINAAEDNKPDSTNLLSKESKDTETKYLEEGNLNRAAVQEILESNNSYDDSYSSKYKVKYSNLVRELKEKENFTINDESLKNMITALKHKITQIKHAHGKNRHSENKQHPHHRAGHFGIHGVLPDLSIVTGEHRQESHHVSNEQDFPAEKVDPTLDVESDRLEPAVDGGEISYIPSPDEEEKSDVKEE